ncbi:hypothetical protein GQR58_021438 [Nymphon striatum]|nr:hypothetical protein GQR58_021438 [Nymphon striatum]
MKKRYSTKEELQVLLDRVVEASAERGLTINDDKTKCMVISKTPQKPKCHIKVGNIKIKETESFSYLGSLVTSDGKCKKEKYHDKFKCQHGPNEVLGNLMQGCTFKYMTDMDKQVGYMECMDTYNPAALKTLTHVTIYCICIQNYPTLLASAFSNFL